MIRNPQNVGGRGMKYDEWETSVPEEIRNDSLWRMEAYRLALFADEIA